MKMNRSLDPAFSGRTAIPKKREWTSGAPIVGSGLKTVDTVRFGGFKKSDLTALISPSSRKKRIQPQVVAKVVAEKVKEAGLSSKKLLLGGLAFGGVSITAIVVFKFKEKLGGMLGKVFSKKKGSRSENKSTIHEEGEIRLVDNENKPLTKEKREQVIKKLNEDKETITKELEAARKSFNRIDQLDLSIEPFSFQRVELGEEDKALSLEDKIEKLHENVDNVLKRKNQLESKKTGEIANFKARSPKIFEVKYSEEKLNAVEELIQAWQIPSNDKRVAAIKVAKGKYDNVFHVASSKTEEANQSAFKQIEETFDPQIKEAEEAVEREGVLYRQQKRELEEDFFKKNGYYPRPDPDSKDENGTHNYGTLCYQTFLPDPNSFEEGRLAHYINTGKFAPQAVTMDSRFLAQQKQDGKPK